MKKSTGINIFGTVVSMLLAFSNFVHAFFTWGICAEQIKTGWGFGTNWEMGVLWPWLVEILSVPIIFAGITFLIINIWKKSEKTVFVLCTVLLILQVLQIILLNLFLNW